MSTIKRWIVTRLTQCTTSISRPLPMTVFSPLLSVISRSRRLPFFLLAFIFVLRLMTSSLYVLSMLSLTKGLAVIFKWLTA